MPTPLEFLRIGFGPQDGRHQYGCRDVMWKCSINQFIDQAVRIDIVWTTVDISYYIEREGTNLL